MSTSRKRPNANRQKTGAKAHTDVQLLGRLAAGTVSLEPAGHLARKVSSGLADMCSE